MKKLSIVFLMHLTQIILNAQVGIGTTDPQATLHIVSKSDTLLLIDKEDSEGNITPAVTVDNEGNMFTRGTVTISQNYTMPLEDGNTDDVLVTDGNGQVFWKPINDLIDTGSSSSGLLIKKLNSSHTLYTSNNAKILRLSDTGLTSNPAQEELLKLPNTNSGSQGAWHFNKIEGGVHGKHIHLINDSVKSLRIDCSSQSNSNTNKIVELGRNQSNININKGGAIELYYDGSYEGWIVMYYRNN